MTWILFVVTALVIVFAGVRLAKFGDIIGETSGLGRSWIGVVLLAATTSLPELVSGFGATALSSHPELAIGNVLGACMVNFLILSLMDALHPKRLSAEAYQGHALTIGFGVLMLAVVGIGLMPSFPWPVVGWVGAYSLVLMSLYLFAMRVIFSYTNRQPRAAEDPKMEPYERRRQLKQALRGYGVAAVFVVAGALALPGLGATIAADTGLGEAFVGSVFMALVTCLPEIVVSVAAVRLGALDMGIANVLGSNLFNLFVLGLNDVFFREQALLTGASATHSLAVFSLLLMNAVFLIGLTEQVATKRFVVAWDTGAIACFYIGTISIAAFL